MIAEEFGANATYVEGLLQRFRSNPDLVDDSWRAYFNELVNNGAAKTVTTTTDGDARPAATPRSPHPSDWRPGCAAAARFERQHRRQSSM